MVNQKITGYAKFIFPKYFHFSCYMSNYKINAWHCLVEVEEIRKRIF